MTIQARWEPYQLGGWPDGLVPRDVPTILMATLEF